MRRSDLIFGSLFLLLANTTHAACNVDAINRIVSKSLPNVKFDLVRKAPVRGLCEAQIDTEVFYVSEKGDFLVVGNLIAVESGDNLTLKRRGAIVKQIVADQDESQMVVIGPASPRATITVFTDVDCPYCSKLHEEVPELNRQGVKIRYLLYPRNGVNSPTYTKSVSVWCAADRVEAIGIAKAGGRLPKKTCKNPVADHYKLGARLGVNGTPTLILEDGTRIGGYLPAARLLMALGLQPAISDPIKAK